MDIAAISLQSSNYERGEIALYLVADWITLHKTKCLATRQIWTTLIVFLAFILNSVFNILKHLQCFYLSDRMSGFSKIGIGMII